jgi:hypothetical protein
VGRRHPDRNVTFRLDPDLVLWARMRAFRHGTSLTRVLTRFLEVYAAVPEEWWQRRSLPHGSRTEPGWAVGDPLPSGLDGSDLFAVEGPDPER